MVVGSALDLSSVSCPERAGITSLGDTRRPWATWSSIEAESNFRAGPALRDLGWRTLKSAMKISVFAEIPLLFCESCKQWSVFQQRFCALVHFIDSVQDSAVDLELIVFSLVFSVYTGFTGLSALGNVTLHSLSKQVGFMY